MDKTTLEEKDLEAKVIEESTDTLASDWEAEWEKIKANFIAVKQGEWWSSDEDFIKDFIRKAYQRGREEGGDIMTKTCLETLEEQQKSLLSLAVQEIEKGKYVARGHTYASGFNEGLDKAKSILKNML